MTLVMGRSLACTRWISGVYAVPTVGGAPSRCQSFTVSTAQLYRPFEACPGVNTSLSVRSFEGTERATAGGRDLGASLVSHAYLLYAA